MYNVKEDAKKSTSLKYKPFPAFDHVNASVSDRISAIEKAISNGRDNLAIILCSSLLHDGLEGLRYLQTYDWLFLRALITIGYLGWIAYALTTVIDLHVLQGAVIAERTTTTTLMFSSILVLLYASFVIDRSPITYYGYAFFPVFFWEEVFARRKGCIAGMKVLFENVQSFSRYIGFAFQFVFYIAILEALVST